MTSVISFTKQLSTGPKQYSYDCIGGISTPEYLRQHRLKQYRKEQAAHGHIVPKGSRELAVEEDYVNYIRGARDRNQSFRAIGRHLGISYYKVQRICELQGIE